MRQEPTNVGHLRKYDHDTSGALYLVIGDVVDTQALSRPAVEALSNELASAHVDAVGEIAGGELAIWVAEAVQEMLIEQRDDHIWPACPRHPNHPLWLDGGADAHWCCPTSGEWVAALGGLGQAH